MVVAVLGDSSLPVALRLHHQRLRQAAVPSGLLSNKSVGRTGLQKGLRFGQLGRQSWRAAARDIRGAHRQASCRAVTGGAETENLAQRNFDGKHDYCGDYWILCSGALTTALVRGRHKLPMP